MNFLPISDFRVKELDRGGFGVYTKDGKRVHGICSGTFDNEETAKSALHRYVRELIADSPRTEHKRKKVMPQKRTVFVATIKLAVDVNDAEAAVASLRDALSYIPGIVDWVFVKRGRAKSGGFREVEIPVDTQPGAGALFSK